MAHCIQVIVSAATLLLIIVALVYVLHPVTPGYHDGGGDNDEIELVTSDLAIIGLKKAEWEAGIDYERTFWRRFMKEKGAEWGKEYERRVKPSPLQDDILKLIKDPGPLTRILDAGAGPLTALGNQLPQKSEENGKEEEIATVELIPTDPLARVYDEILAEVNIRPPVRTLGVAVEELSQHFPEDYFDLTHMQNALDHSKDPLHGIKEMLVVTKPGCVVNLIHYRNEGEREDYIGFHQWNLDAVDGKFIISRPDKRIDVAEALSDSVSRIEAYITPDATSVAVHIWKAIKK